MVVSFGVARTMPLTCAGIYFLGCVRLLSPALTSRLEMGSSKGAHASKASLLVSNTASEPDSARPAGGIDWAYIRFVLDETDGRLARMFNQTSTFGAVLDMVTDRQGARSVLVPHPVIDWAWIAHADS